MTQQPGIGLGDFRKLREDNRLYVDKSRFILDVLADPAEVLLFPRPRRFGKSLNLTMLRYFFEKTSEDLRHLFEGLEVWKHDGAREHFQRYPVIFVTFKDVQTQSFAQTVESTRAVMRGAYEEHVYLLQGGALQPEQQAHYRTILSGGGSEIALRNALRDLSDRLASYHQSKVVVLIDEYDTPIHAGHRNGFYEEVVEFFRGCYSAVLKDNNHLFRGVLSGILRVARESMFSGLNNLVVRSILYRPYSRAFGFTEEEVADLLGPGEHAERIRALREWYGGHRFGPHGIFNPWSIVRYLADQRLSAYWAATSSDDLIHQFFTTNGTAYSADMEALLAGNKILKRIDENISLRGIESRKDALWSLLLFSGYLGLRKAEETPEGIQAELAIPNLEVLRVYQDLFRTWLNVRLGGDEANTRLRTAFLAGDAAAIRGLLRSLMLETISFHDTALPQPEKFYQGFVIGLLVNLSDTHVVKSNREAGDGRADILVLPRRPGGAGVVLELKVARPETLRHAVLQASRQVRERDYAAALREAGAEPIHLLVAAFDGKDVLVERLEPLAFVVSFFQWPEVGLPSGLGVPVQVPAAPLLPRFLELWRSPIVASCWREAVAVVEAGVASVVDYPAASMHVFLMAPLALAFLTGRLLQTRVRLSISTYELAKDGRWLLFLPAEHPRLARAADYYKLLPVSTVGARGRDLVIAVDGQGAVSSASAAAVHERVGGGGLFRLCPQQEAYIHTPHEAENALRSLEAHLQHLCDAYPGRTFHLLVRAPGALVCELGRSLRASALPPFVFYEYDLATDVHHPALRFDGDTVTVVANGS